MSDGGENLISWRLIWLGTLVLFAGFFLAKHLREQYHPSAAWHASICLGTSILISGLLAIIATRRWWFHR